MSDLYAYGYDGNKPGGWPAAWLTYDEMMQRTVWNRVHPEVRRRFKAVMDDARAAGVTIGVGGAWRSAAQQEATFRARYSPDVSAQQKAIAKSKITWNGQVWYIKSNSLAPSTPPGLSYHEETIDQYALAIDSTGAWDWFRELVPNGKGQMVRRISLYGLVEFNNVNDEPWHVQPAEIPTSRRNYKGTPLVVWDLPGTVTPPVEPPVEPPYVPPTNPTPVNSDLMIKVWKGSDCAAEFIGMVDKNGNALEIRWIQGDPKYIAMRDAHIAAGAPVETQPLTNRRWQFVTLLGPVPYGDSYAWTEADFFLVKPNA